MATRKIGGSGSETPYFHLYVLGLVLGTLIRIVVFITPIGVVRRLEEALLPDDMTDNDILQSQ